MRARPGGAGSIECSAVYALPVLSDHAGLCDDHSAGPVDSRRGLLLRGRAAQCPAASRLPAFRSPDRLSATAHEGQP
jgi:hypothetical protein